MSHVHNYGCSILSMADKDLNGIVIINLMRRTDRLRAVMGDLLRSDLRDVETSRLPAHDGRANDWSHMLTSTAKRELKRLADTHLRDHHAQLTPGAVGCYLSHVDAYRWIVDQGRANKDMDAPYLILEDDVGIPSVSRAALRLGWNLARKRAGSDPLMLLLYTNCIGKCPIDDRGLIEPEAFWGLQCCVMSPRDAQALLRTELFPMDVQLDTKLKYLRNEGRLRIFVFNAFQNSKTISDTDIQSHTVPLAPLDRPATSA